MNCKRVYSPPREEGWPRHYKMAPFRKGADGVVARGSRFAMRFETFACERPPRLRRFGGFATFYSCRSHPSFARRGKYATLKQFPNSFTPITKFIPSFTTVTATRTRSDCHPLDLAKSLRRRRE